MMIFDRNEQKAVVALLGAGSMGTAIVRRIGAGKKILLGDISEKALERVGDDFRRCGYDVETLQVNAFRRKAWRHSQEGSRTGACDVFHRYRWCIAQSGQTGAHR